MEFGHRITERKASEDELRRAAKQIMELAGVAKLHIERITAYGGPQAEDFNGDSAENAAARITETIIGLEAAAMMFATLEQSVGEYGVTVKTALLRIAAA